MVCQQIIGIVGPVGQSGAVRKTIDAEFASVEVTDFIVLEAAGINSLFCLGEFQSQCHVLTAEEKRNVIGAVDAVSEVGWV